jgi:hypothetical protein
VSTDTLFDDAQDRRQREGLIEYFLEYSVGILDRQNEDTVARTITGRARAGFLYPSPRHIIESRRTNNDNANIPPTENGHSALWDGKLVLRRCDRLTLPEGHYFFTGIRISGRACLQLTGPAVFYVAGPIHIRGRARINQGGHPANLIILQYPAAEGRANDRREGRRRRIE